ncbi:MAG: CSLREA domain-containing protein, partial [Pirellulaceae bacterium]
GIDLGLAGATANDSADPDVGGNNRQNYPNIFSAAVGAGAVKVYYLVDTDTANGAFPLTIEFFAADADQEEGKSFLASDTYSEADWFGCGTPPCSKIAVFAVIGGLTVGDSLLATATDFLGSTSEFSAAIETVGGRSIVNSTADTTDAQPGDGVCYTGRNNSDAEPECTFRAALEESNAAAGLDSIMFAMPVVMDSGCNNGTGVCTIMPDSALPDITEAVVLDGETQSGATCGASFVGRDLRVVLDGTNAGAVTGLTLANGSAGSVIKGLVIHSFGAGGMLVSSDSNHVACSHIGVDATGLLDLGNVGTGITLNVADYNVIGTDGDGVDDSSEGNVISGNGNRGIFVTVGSGHTTIAGNHIGVNVSATSSIGNGNVGILNNHGPSIIGTNGDGVSDLLEANVIGGNAGSGVQLQRVATSGTKVAANFIGTDPTETLNLGNTGAGVRTDGKLTSAWIGADLDGMSEAAEGNAIAFNGGDGVFVVANGISVLGNRIFSNTGLGIDLLPNGVTANDSADVDAGANNLQNYPDITSADLKSGSLTVVYSVNSATANSLYPLRIEFFLADGDQEEGAKFLGSGTYTTAEYSGCGSAPCSDTTTFAVTGIAHGDSVLATATDDDGNTSEFSAPVEVLAHDLTVNSTDDDSDQSAGDGFCYTGQMNSQGQRECTLRAAIEEANAFAGKDTISFSVPSGSDSGCNSGTGVCSLTPASPYSLLLDAVVIDGTTQPGADCSTKSLKIVLDGGTTVTNGFALNGSAAAGSTFRGLVIKRFKSDGISISSTFDNVVECNVIGTDLAGASGLGNGNVGVNVIASHDNTIGSNGDGIDDGAEANVIAFNEKAGVRVWDVSIPTRANAILGNAIFANGGLGIDLEGSLGPDANDAGDADTGANNLQNYPDVDSAYVVADSLTVIYSVDSDTAHSDYPLRVEFFEADSGNEEGRRFLGFDSYSISDWSDCGSAPCVDTVSIAVSAFAAGDTLVATATDALGNTSEFSAPIEVAARACIAPLTLKAFLEGPYDSTGDTMRTSLVDAGELPLSHPFSDPIYNGTVLDFDGDVSLTTMPDSVAEWVLVSLRTGTGAGTEYQVQPALIFEDGAIATPGNSAVCADNEGGSVVYVVVRSRNHLDIMSSGTVDISGGSGSWDFTTAATQAFGSDAQKELETGVYGMFAGDGTFDGQVTASDFNLWLVDTKAVKTGYLLSDYNLDVQVTASDFNLWLVNTKAVAMSKVP